MGFARENLLSCSWFPGTTSPWSGSLDAGAEQNVTVAPSAVDCLPGTDRAYLYLSSNGGAETVTVTLTVTPPPTGTIVVRVSLNGTGVCCMTVGLHRPGSEVPSYTATTNAAGEAGFTSVPEGTWYVVINPASADRNYLYWPTTSKMVSLSGGETETVDFPGSTVGRITAFVRAGGSPLPGVSVSVSGPVSRSAVTDATGRAVFTNLPVGTYTVSATIAGVGTRSRTVTLRGGQNLSVYLDF
jgi:hypothetical protein